MSSGQFTLAGAREVADLLGLLPDRLAKNMMVSSMRAGAVVFRDDIRRRAPTGSPPLPRGEKVGTLRHAIGVTARRAGDQIIAGVRIAKSAFYWRFVEYGTAAKSAAKGVFTRGIHGHHATRAYPFVRPAFDANAEAAANAVVDSARSQLDAAVADQGIYLQGYDEAA